MLTLDNLTKQDVAAVLHKTILQRSRAYTNRVNLLTRTGDQLQAKVRGAKTYEVVIIIRNNRIRGLCNCPSDWEGYCKHIGATLLKWVGDSPAPKVKKPERDPAGLAITHINPPRPNLPEQPPTWPTESLPEINKQNHSDFAEYLSEYRVKDLRQIAKKIGCKLSGTKKSTISQQIVTHLSQHGHAIRLMQALDPELQAVLQGMMTLGIRGNFSAEDAKQFIENWFHPLSRHKKLDAYLQRLVEQGLLISNDSGAYYAPLGFVPFAIWQASSPPLDKVLTDVESQLTDGEFVLSDPAGYISHIHRLITYFNTHKTSLRPPQPRPELEETYPNLRSWPYIPQEIAQANAKNQLKKQIGNEYTIPPADPPLADDTLTTLTSLNSNKEQINFTYHLLVKAGLFMLGSPITRWADHQEAFLKQSSAHQRAILAKTYFNLESWNELWRILHHTPTLKLKRIDTYRRYEWPDFQGELSSFRYLILRVLTNIPHNRWVSLNSFFELMRPILPHFSANVFQIDSWGHADNKPAWFLTEGKQRPLKTDSHPANWHKVQGKYITTMLGGPLHWLGLVDLYRKDNEIVAFRLNGLADLFLERSDAPPLPGRDTTTTTTTTIAAKALTTNHHTIHIKPTHISGNAHTYLTTIAQLENASPTQFTFQLSATQTHTTFEAGQTLNQLLSDWQTHFNQPPPPTIQQQLTQWWTTYGQVRLYENISVIELADDHALTELKAITQLDNWLIAEISPRLLLIRPEGIDPLIAQLEKAGYNPKHTNRP